MSKTIDAEKFDVESLPGEHGMDDDILDTLSIAQIDDRSYLKRLLSHWDTSFHYQITIKNKEFFQLPQREEVSTGVERTEE